MNKKPVGSMILGAAVILGACRPSPEGAAAIEVRSRQERMAIRAALNLERVDTLLLPAMRAAGIDCWIIMSREFNEDFVLDYIEDQKGATGGHRNAYIFFDDGSERAQRIVIGTHLAEESRVWDRRISYHSGQGREGPSLKPALREAIEQLDPKRIGVNISRTIPMCDGLTVGMRDFLVEAIGPKYAGRLVSAERLIVDFLDTRLPAELEHFAEAAEITRRIHEEVFHRGVITPGATTLGDVRQSVYDRLADLGLETWYVPIIRVSRADGDFSEERTVIQRGDLVHTDIGIVYVGLFTDYQKNAYVLREGESEPPAGLREAFRNSLKVQDAILQVSRAGRIGYQLKEDAERLCAEWGVKASVYSHSTGVPGHGIGASLNFDWPDRYGVRATFPLRSGAIYSVESSATTAVPEWNGREIAIGTEENAYLEPDGLKYFTPRQEALYLIK